MIKMLDPHPIAVLERDMRLRFRRDERLGWTSSFTLEAFEARVAALLALPETSLLDLAPIFNTAISLGQLPWVKSLINIGYPLDGANFVSSPLSIAAYDGNLPIIEALLDSGAPPDDPPETVHPSMVTALMHKHTPVALTLLKHGANPNHIPPGLPSYLHHACSFGNEDVVAALLVRGADPFANYNGFTPAQWAREKGHPGSSDIIDTFVEARALADSTPRPASPRSPPAKKSL